MCEEHQDSVGRVCPVCTALETALDDVGTLKVAASAQGAEIDRLSNLLESIKKNAPEQYVIATLQQEA